MGERLSSAPIINLEEMRQNRRIGAEGGAVAGCSLKSTPASTISSKVERRGSSSSRAP